MVGEPVYTPLCELNGDRDDWLICVKVHHVWHQTYKNSPTQVSSKKMILLDSQGNKIHASIKKNLLHDFDHALEEGNHVELSNFGVGTYGGRYMVVDHQYKVNFYRATKVRKVEPFEDVDGYSMVAYDDVKNSMVNPDVAFDVVGQVIENGNMRILLDDRGKQSKMVTCVLRDVDGKTLDCALWGDFAAKLNAYVQEKHVSSDPLVMFIQLAKMKSWNCKPQISNSLFGTRLFINDNVKPIIDFKTSLISCSEGSCSSTPSIVLSANVEIENPVDYYNKFPIRTIAEVRELNKAAGCVVVATIIKVLLDDGWFYYYCKQCSTTVDKDEDIADGGAMFTCYHCGPVNEANTNVRTVLRVQDSSGSTSISMFSSVVAKMLKKAENWLKLKVQNGGHPNVLPDEFESILNKQFVFKLQVSKFNIDNECAGYTVHRMTDDGEIITNQLKRFDEELGQGDNDNAFITPTSKMCGSTFSNNMSPIPFVDINLEGSARKRISASTLEDHQLMSSTSKKSEDVESLKIPRLEDN